VEYTLKARAGITPATNSFFSHYYFITFVHLLHVVAGVSFIAYFRSLAPVRTGSLKYQIQLENVGLLALRRRDLDLHLSAALPGWPVIKPVLIWICLCALSIVSVVQLKQGWSGSAAAVLVVVIAAMKVHLVMRHYMEVTSARRLWRFLYGAWTFAAAATITAGYVLSLRS
jgi:hypothetical protein